MFHVVVLVVETVDREGVFFFEQHLISTTFLVLSIVSTSTLDEVDMDLETTVMERVVMILLLKSLLGRKFKMNTVVRHFSI